MKFKAWFEKKGILSSYVCCESHLVNVPISTWWIDSGSTIHVATSVQGFLSQRLITKGE